MGFLFLPLPAFSQNSPQFDAIEAAIWQLDSSGAAAAIRKLTDAEKAAFYHTNLLFIIAVTTQRPDALVAHLTAADKRIDQFGRQPETADRLAYRAELYFEQGVVKLIQQKRWTAMWAMREAYRTTQLLARKYPGGSAHHKLLGLFEVGLASVPDQYKWLLGLLGYRGNMALGFMHLQQAMQAGKPLVWEAHAARYLATKFAQNDPDAAGTLLDSAVAAQPYILARYLQATSLLDRHLAQQAEAAIVKLSEEKEVAAGHLPMVWHLLGRAKLYASSYTDARRAYQRYCATSRGSLLLRDAAYKIGLCYLLQADTANARRNFAAVVAFPESTSDEDNYATRYAARYLAAMPDATEQLLLQARYAFDGGYYSAALRYMAQLRPQALLASQRTEYFYRKGRIYQFNSQPDSARSSYQACISSVAGKLWMRVHAYYYLGVIAETQGRYAEARDCYRRIPKYSSQDYDYKQALEQRTEAALARLGQKK